MRTIRFLLFTCVVSLILAHSIDSLAGQSLHPFIEEYCKDAVPLDTGIDVQRFGVESVTLHQGLYIELGVCGGGSINHIASLIPFQLIYGFDSFEGLPDEWDKGGHFEIIPAGSWGRDTFPYVLPNVRLIKGWFKDTLPEFVHTWGDEPIAFLHVDCDIYSSTVCALSTLAPMIQEGTIIVFDELYNYPNYKNHELKAFNEFLETHAFEAEYLAYCRVHEQVAVRMHKK